MAFRNVSYWNHPTNHKQLIMELSIIQSELKAPKGNFNSFGKYKYRSCEDIVEAVKPVLLKHGFALIITDELLNIGERYYIKATALITNGTTHYNAVGWAREEEIKKGMDAAQITGSASSYARKYALNGLLAIDDTKDADTIEHKDEIGDDKRLWLITLLENSTYEERQKEQLALKIEAINSQVDYDKALINLQANQIEDKDRIAMGMNYNATDIKKTLKNLK
jgi:hypothetical protein